MLWHAYAKDWNINIICIRKQNIKAEGMLPKFIIKFSCLGSPSISSQFVRGIFKELAVLMKNLRVTARGRFGMLLRDKKNLVKQCYMVFNFVIIMPQNKGKMTENI